MISGLPIYIELIFGLSTFITIMLFFKAAHNSRSVLIVISIWLTIQFFIGRSEFYLVTDTMPPRFLVLVMPSLLLILGLFTFPIGRRFINNLDIGTLTYLHSIRIPIEIVLYLLFLEQLVPEIMTFSGRNFDIIAGLTAPIIGYFGFKLKSLDFRIILTWNFISLGLLLNIIINAVLSAPSPFQQFAFEQPNVAILHSPFVWIPSTIVPIVFLSHLATIKQLLSKAKTNRLDKNSDSL